MSAPVLGPAYERQLRERFNRITTTVERQAENLAPLGRVMPALEDLAIGSARQYQAAAWVFDIRSFSARTAGDDTTTLHNGLTLLNTVIPTIMGVIFDFDGQVEKNTGDGIFALIGVGEALEAAALNALNAVVVSRWLLRHLVNA